MRSERNANQLDNPNNPELVPPVIEDHTALMREVYEREKVALLVVAAKAAERRIRELLGEVYSDPFDAAAVEARDADIAALRAAIRLLDQEA